MEIMCRLSVGVIIFGLAICVPIATGNMGVLEITKKETNMTQNGKQSNYLTMAQYTAAIQEVEGLISELQKSYQILNSGISQNAQTISNMFAGTDEKIEAIDAKAKGLRNEFTQTSVELCLSGVADRVCSTCAQDSGRRYGLQSVNFREPFKKTPVVIGIVSRYDGISGTPVRYSLKLSATTTYLTIKFETWADTRVSAPDVAWMACA